MRDIENQPKIEVQGADSPSVDSNKKSIELLERGILKPILTIAVPLGVGIAAVNEFAFFEAVGLPDSWQFAAVLPIPLTELLRFAVVSALLTAVSLVFVLGIYYYIVANYHLFGRCLKRLSDQIGVNPRQAARESINVLLLTDIGIKAKNVYFYTINLRKIRSDGESWRMHEIIMRCATFALFSLAALDVGRVMIPLVLDWLFPARNLASALIGLVAYILWAAVTLGCLAWLLGASIDGMLNLKISRAQSLIFGAILFFCGVFDSGYQSGLRAQGLINAGSGHELRIDIDSSKCHLFHSGLLLRSYSNGYLLLSGGQLAWFPVGEGSCWVVNTSPKNFYFADVTPTIFGIPIYYLSRRVLRENKGK